MRVAVVGTCASGKSSIAEGLNQAGFDAYVVGQEHSAIPRLWQRQSPDALVFLEVTLDVIRDRRGVDWPEWLYLKQLQRLSDARDHADAIVDTGSLDIDRCVALIVDELGTKSG